MKVVVDIMDEQWETALQVWVLEHIKMHESNPEEEDLVKALKIVHRYVTPYHEWEYGEEE